MSKKSKKTRSFLATLIVLVIFALVFLKITARADSLVGLNEGYGTVVHDNSGSAVGNITGATWKSASECLSGPCLYFDGSVGDYVNFGDENTFDFAAATNWTIELWFRTASISSGTRTLVSKYNATAGGYKIYMTSDGKINFGVDDDSTWGPDDIATSVNRYDDNKWHFVTATKTGTSNIILYIDTLRVAQKNSLTAIGTLANANNFCVGGDGACTTNNWLGFIDEMKVVIASARTPDQVNADYQKGVTSHGTSARFGPDTSTLTQGLVGYWKMDEATWGTPNCSTGVVLDSSGNGYNGIACPANTGPTGGAAGKFGNGGTFDGVDDLINVTTNIKELDSASALTISLWAKITTFNAWNTLFNKNVDGTHGILIQEGNSSGEIYALLMNGTNSTGYTTSAYTIGQWFHITMVFDGTGAANADRLKLYINGAQRTLDFLGTTIPSTTANLNTVTNLGNGVVGSLDDVRIYNRALSPAEVSQLYNWAPGPIGWWKMDENQGIVAYDSSGNGYDFHDMSTGRVKWIPGKMGSALYVSSSTDSVGSSQLGGALDNAKTFTTSTWVRYRQQVDWGGVISGKGPDTSHCFLIQQMTSANPGSLIFYLSNGVDAYGYTPNNIITFGQWFHVEMVYDGNGSGNSGKLKAYVNGIPIPLNFSGTTIPSTTANMSSDPFYASVSPDTDIDEVKVYNYVRTPSQVIEDMNGSHPAPGSPIGSALVQYKFDEATGTALNNSGSVGSSANATNSGTLWNLDGKFNSAQQFNGTNSFVSSPKLALLAGDTSPYNTLTWSGWFKPISSAASKTLIIKRNEFRLTTDASSRPNCAIYSGSWQTAAIGITALPLNSWSHVMCIYDGSNIHVYVNGTEAGGPVSQTGNLTSSSSTGLNLGWNFAGGEYFRGLMDEVKIYNLALTADQVKAEFNQGVSSAMGVLSDTSGLSGGSVASNSASAAYCVPGSSDPCSPPVGEWKLDEYSNGSAPVTRMDSSGHNNNLTDSGDVPISSVNGKIGNAAMFTIANSQYLLITNANQTGLNITGPITLCAWFNHAADTNVDEIVTKGGYDPSQQAYRLFIYNGNELHFGVSPDGTPLNEVDVSLINAFTDGVWTYGCGVYTGSQLQLYINGQLATTPVNYSSGIFSNTLDFTISDHSSADFFNGDIDMVRVYNYARTPAQIAWDYNRGAPVAWYKFDECTGLNAYDSAPKADPTNPRYDGFIAIGASPPQNASGTCTGGSSSMAWYNGANGKFNASLNLDGTDDYVTVSAFSPLAGAGGSVTNVSWGGWFKPASSVASKTLMEKTSEFRLVTDASGNPTCGAYPFTSLSAATASAALTLSAWSDVTCTYDGSNIKVYINGNQAAVKPYANSITAASSILYMGESSSGAQRYQGQLDDIRIYTYSLTPVQINTIYNGGSTVKF